MSAALCAHVSLYKFIADHSRKPSRRRIFRLAQASPSKPGKLK
jgi:hypothetical protein